MMSLFRYWMKILFSIWISFGYVYIASSEKNIWHLTNGEASVMLELWEMLSTPFLPSFPGPLWPGVVAPDRVLSIGHIKLFNHLTVCKQMVDV